MGQPNFKRLAELGQLPEYAREQESIAIINEKAIEKKEEKIKKEIVLKSELVAKCEELGLETSGNKPELMKRIEEFEKQSKREIGEESNDGEFVDELLG